MRPAVGGRMRDVVGLVALRQASARVGAGATDGRTRPGSRKVPSSRMRDRARRRGCRSATTATSKPPPRKTKFGENSFSARNKSYSVRMVHVGIGYDVHQLVAGRKLVLGGVEIPHAKGLDGHSD